MNAAWLVLDSVSWDATPFAENGPDTLPQMEELAADRATVFTQCYSSGTASPDSHSSFFTGRYSSQTGYHRGYYEYDGAFPTVADATDETHESILVTQNQYVLALGSSFDRVVDVGDQNEFSAPFPEATDPDEEKDLQQYDPLQRYLEFVKRDGKPLRSIVNGLFYKYNDTFNDQYYTDVATDRINEEIREFEDEDEPTYIVANYMGAHPPFAPTEEAIRQFVDEERIGDLPVGETLPYRHSLESSEYDMADVEPLYHATIWDLDRKVTPLIEELLEQGTAVFVFSDHGTCVDYVDPMADARTHVPLLVFTPEGTPRRVPQTVNLRHIAPTTTALLQEHHPAVERLPGRNLLTVEDSEISITEYIHYGREGDPSPSNTAIAHAEEELVYRATARRDGARVDYFDHDGQYEIVSGDETATETLTDALGNHLETVVTADRPDGEQTDSYDVDEDRLRHLGYLE